MDEAVCAGVDGCRAGWFYVGIAESLIWSVGVTTNAGELFDDLPVAKRILIDMPIGLLESGCEGRRCDAAARKLLGRPRASSVFPVPVRPTLQAKSYAEANAINRSLSGRGLSRQAWGLVPKVRELDGLLRSSVHARSVMREAHPEICFQAFNGGQAMAHNKKTPAGRQEREAILLRLFPLLPDLLAEALGRYRRGQLGRDDILDALVLAVAARHGRLRTLPEESEMDAAGLPMEIVYPVV